MDLVHRGRHFVANANANANANADANARTWRRDPGVVARVLPPVIVFRITNVT